MPKSKEKEKIRLISNISAAAFVLLAIFALSFGFKSTEKLKAAYSSAVCPSGDVVISADTTWDDTAYMLNGSSYEIHCKSITINTGRTLTIPPKTTATKASLSGRKLVLDNDLTVNGTLILDGGGKSTASNGFGLELYITGNATISSSGVISADGNGYDVLDGPGGGTFAAYGGEGPPNFAGAYDVSTVIYGSASDPIDLGSGGNPGSGGGIIKIVAGGSITNNGAIHADGPGYASGGSINLSANTITGSATSIISASNNILNGGGGGRIAIKYTSSNTFAGSVNAYGGTTIYNNGAGAGTIFYSKNDGTEKELVIANNNQYHGASFSNYDINIGKTRIESNTYKNIKIEKGSNVYSGPASVITISGETFEINNSKFTNNGQINSGTPFGSLLVKNTAQFFNAGTGINMPNSNINFDEANTYFENQNNQVQYLGNLNITNGALLSHAINDATGATNCIRTQAENPSGSIPYCENKNWGDGNSIHWNQKYALRISASNVFIDSKSSIDVSQKGFTSVPSVGGGFGPGGSTYVAGLGYRAGASYGGRGGDNIEASASAYGDASDPNDLGSSAYAGINGGGLVRIYATGTINNNGSILSNSGDYAYSTGSGGGIKLEADNMLGAGYIAANGGEDGYAGAGGGRIAIIYKTKKDFYGPINAYGANEGGPGTIFFAKNNSGTLIDKELVIANNSLNLNPTKIKGDTYKDITVKNNSTILSDKTAASIDPTETVGLQDGGVFEINKSNFTNNGVISLQSGTSSLIVKNNSGFYNVGPGASSGINANSSSKIVFDNSTFENQNNLILNLGNVTLQNGASMTHKVNDTITCFRTVQVPGADPPCALTADPAPDVGTHYNQNYTLRISAANVYIDVSSKIDVSEKGYGSHMGPGASSVTYAGGISGATYGGKGLDDGSGVASYYGSASDPDDLGSGAHSADTSVFGGGLVRIEATGSVSNNGSIKADATLSQNYAGHSGGGIKIQAADILGIGIFSARGSESTVYGKYGGGGRIALIYTKKNYSGTISVDSGGAGAENGTVYDNNSGGAPVTIGPSTSQLNYSSLPANNISYIRASSVSSDTVVDEDQPFGAYNTDAYTKLLLHMDGTNGGTNFSDSSGTNKLITPVSAVTSTTKQEFGTASGLFNGTGSLLTTPDSDDWYFGSGDFTIDTWIYLNQLPPSGAGNSYTIASQWQSSSEGWHLTLSNNDYGVYGLAFVENHLGTNVIGNCSQSAGDMTFWSDQIGKWAHIAVVRSGNNFLFYANGQELYSCSNSTPIYDFNASLMVGGNTIGGRYFNGYIDELRVSKGIARWTSPSFTLQSKNIGTNLSLKAVKTIPTPIPDSDVKLLLHMNGNEGESYFSDSSGLGKTVTPALPPNNPITKTSHKVFGSASGYFYGTTATVPNSSDFSFGTDDWTIDFWFYFIGLGYNGFSGIVSANVPYDYGVFPFPSVNVYGTTLVAIENSIDSYHQFTVPALNDGNFHHIAVTRSGADMRVFVDGIQSSSGPWNIGTGFSYSNSNGLKLGELNEAPSGAHYYTYAYLDELRIKKGVADWTSNFNVPSSEYTGYSGSTDIDDTFNGTADIYLTDNQAGQYVFSGCTGASCQSFSDHITATFTNGLADLNVRIKDLRTGEIKHHGFSSFRFVTSAPGYLNNNVAAATTELQDEYPERPISASNIVVGSKIFNGGVGFSIKMNDQGSAQYQKDLGGYLVIRGPVGGAYSFTPDRGTMYKVGDVPATGYTVICVGLANYGDTKRCEDNTGVVAGNYAYGFYTFNKTYDFYTQNEASNYSLPAPPSPITIPSGTIEPDNATSLSVTPNSGRLTVVWTNPADNIGQTKTLIIRRKNIVGDNTGPNFIPTDGTDYNNGSNTLVANEDIVYDSTNVGGSAANISFDDTDIIYGTNYCYDIYTQFVGLNYPPAGLPNSVCAVPTPMVNPVPSFSATVNGMRVSLAWGTPSPSASLTKYLIVRKAGSVPDFVPTNGTDYVTPATTPFKLSLGSGNFLVYDGNSNSFDDNHVDNVQYYYKAFVQYDFGSGPYYSAGVASAGATPAPQDVTGLTVNSTAPPGPTYNVLITGVNAPSPNYNLTKYLFVREIGVACNITFVPAANTDYSVGPSGVAGENIFLAQASLPTLPYTDAVAVTAGTKICYKVFTQYSGETGGVPSPHLIYSAGTTAQITPPNHPPQIQITNITQTQGTENVVVQYQVLDQDIDTVNVQFTLTSPCGPTVIGNSAPIAATASWSATKTFNWNSAGGVCPNVETNSASIAAKVTDTPGDFNSDNRNFLLDTNSPVLPATASDFNLVLNSKTTNSITIKVGPNPATDTNPIVGDYAFKMYYAAGATVNTSGTLINIPPDTPFNNYTTAKTKTFTISGLVSGQQYTFNIWMYDNYGHKTAASTALQVTTRGSSPDNFQAQSQGMRGHLSWNAPTIPPTGYLLVRKKGAVASSWVPTDGSSYPSGYVIAPDEKVVLSGAGTSFDDDNVDNVIYTYTVFSNYATNQYSGSVSASLTPNPINVSNIVPSYVPNGPNYDIGLTWNAPSPSYSFQKYIVAREVGDSCSIGWAPTKNTDYTSTGAIPGFPNEYWAYIGSSNSFVDPIAVSSGTKVCYAIFVQYDGEDISNLVYSTGSPLSLVPPNIPPQINTNVSAIQSFDSDQVTINYEVKDSDSTQLDMTFSIINPNSPSCHLNLTDHLTGINGSYSAHSIIWTAASGNGTVGDCPGFELNGAVIRVTANDSLNNVSQDSAGFKLDTRAPQFPTPNSDFNLTNFSSAGSSISFKLGSQSVSDTNPKSGANSIYKIYYSLGSSVDEIMGTLLGGNGFNTYNTSTVYSVSGLTPGSQYTFNIWMYDNYGHKTNAGAVQFSVGVDPVSLFTATPTGMRIILNWNPPVASVPDKYVVLRRAGSAPTTNSLPDGSAYNVDDLVNGDLIIYSGNGIGGNAPPINDDNVDNANYYYKIFTHYSSGKYSSPLSANATAVAEDVTNYNATSTNTKVTLFSDPPTHTTNLNEYLVWKMANSDCTGSWVPSNGVDYTTSSIGGGDIILVQGAVPNNYDDTSISVGTQYCYKTFVKYNGESGDIIYSNGATLSVTPPNNPPQVQILSVIQTPGTEDVVISYQVKDLDSDPVNVTFKMENPCNGNLIDTVLGLPTTGSWSATQTYTLIGAGGVCADQESDVAVIKANITDGFDITSAFSPVFIFDTKAPTTIPILPASSFNLSFSTKTEDSITVKLNSDDFFSSLNALDLHPKGGTATYKIYYDLGNTVDDTTGTLLASFDNYELAKEYTTSVPLLSNQNYAFNIWAYDAYHHEWSAPNPLVIHTGSANSAPEIEFTNQPLQQIGNDNISFSFHYRDPDSDNLTITPSLVNAPGGCNISGVTGFLNPIGSTTLWTDIDAIWNASISCSGQELSLIDNLQIKLSANDGNGHIVDATSNPFTLDTKSPIPAPGNLSVSLDTNAGANETSIDISATAGSDQNESAWKIYRVFGNTFPADPTTLGPIQSYGTYPGVITIGDTGLTPNSDYTYNICLSDTYAHFTCATPQTIHTQVPALNFTIAGVASGQVIGPETTTIDTTISPVSFGDTALGGTQVAALSLQGSSNLTKGYTINVRQDGNLTFGANSIPAYSSTNINPSLWPASTTSSILGYSSLSILRFSGGTKWAGFVTSLDPVVTRNAGGNFSDDFLIKLLLGNSQQTGVYNNTITFSILANP